MKILNKIVAITITCLLSAFAGPTIMGFVSVLFGEDFWSLWAIAFVISLLFYIFAGWPISLLIHYWIKQSRHAFWIRLVLHMLAGVLSIAAWAWFTDDFELIVSSEFLVFYAIGGFHAVVYFLVFSVVRRIASSEFD